MAIDALLARWGLLAIGIGAGLEGETVVVTGGLLAHRGLVSLPGAMAAAAAGSFAADQLFFAIGRRARGAAWVRRWSARPAFVRVLAAFERHPAGFVLAFRFLYGLRTVSPVAIGTTRLPARRFVALNAVAAGAWAVVFTGVGYLFGQGLEALVGRFRPSGLALAGGAAAVLLAIGAWRWWRLSGRGCER